MLLYTLPKDGKGDNGTGNEEEREQHDRRQEKYFLR